MSVRDGAAKAVLAAFTKQIGWCEGLASPFTARLLRLLAEDLAAAGPASVLATGVPVTGADAADWVHARLAEPAPGRTTVLYHSIMWQYLPRASQQAIRASILRAGEHATVAAPFAWLRYEPARAGTRPELQLSLWPGQRDVRLASAHAHGLAVTWLA